MRQPSELCRRRSAGLARALGAARRVDGVRRLLPAPSRGTRPSRRRGKRRCPTEEELRAALLDSVGAEDGFAADGERSGVGGAAGALPAAARRDRRVRPAERLPGRRGRRPSRRDSPMPRARRSRHRCASRAAACRAAEPAPGCSRGSRSPAPASPIIGMGKTGARELNYVSDVDVIFVGRRGRRPDRVASARAAIVDIATRLAVQTMRGISGVEIEPPLWEVDANLRPEGKQGALVRTLDSHLSYYDRWAKSWEFQALLKARPIAGDAALGEAYVRAVQPKIWTSAARENFVDSVQRMRERVTEHIPAAEVPYQLKLGPGGIRDIEFTVQLLQLVHGLSDDRIRQRGTLDALDALVARGLHRPRRGGDVLARLPRAASARASHAAAEPATHAPDALTPRGSARARSRLRPRRHRREGLAEVGVRQARSARHPRPPVLSSAAVGGRLPATRRSARSRPRRPTTGSRRSASPTRRARCGTSRRSPAD